MRRSGVLLSALVLSGLACSSANRVDSLARRCNGGNRDACQELVAIARTHEDAQLRLLATNNITDNKLLLDIVLDRATPEIICKAAINKITDQAALVTIVSHGESWPALEECTRFAITKIVDEAELFKRALNCSGRPWLCEPAVARINDQGLLVRLARESSDAGRHAVTKVTDQAVIVELAMDQQKGWTDARAAAVRKVADQSVLFKLAGDLAQTAAISNLAAEQISDPVLVEKVIATARAREANPRAFDAFRAKELRETAEKRLAGLRAR